MGCDNIYQIKKILNVSIDTKIKNYDYYKNLFNISDAKIINF